MRNERFTQLHKLLVKYDGQVSLRLLRSNHAFNESEVSKLAKHYSDQISIETQVGGTQGGRPSKILKIKGF